MRENETNRRLLRISVQKELLVFHNQVVGINIVRRCFLLTNLGVNHIALLIHGKISCMGRRRSNHIKILDVVIIPQFKLHSANDVCILFFKHIGIDTVVCLA